MSSTVLQGQGCFHVKLVKRRNSRQRQVIGQAVDCLDAWYIFPYPLAGWRKAAIANSILLLSIERWSCAFQLPFYSLLKLKGKQEKKKNNIDQLQRQSADEPCDRYLLPSWLVTVAFKKQLGSFLHFILMPWSIWEDSLKRANQLFKTTPAKTRTPTPWIGEHRSTVSETVL